MSAQLLLDAFLCSSTKGSFTNYVYKRTGVGSPNMSTFVNVHNVENVNRGGKVVKKAKNLST